MTGNNNGLFWITEESVCENTRNDAGRSEKLDRPYEHRKAISDSLITIRESNRFDWYHPGLQFDDNDLPATYIFKAEFNQNLKPRNSESVKNNGITLNYVMEGNKAVITNSRDAFATMERKVEGYANRGVNKGRFKDFDRLSPNTGEDKMSANLRDSLNSTTKNQAVRLQIVPGLDHEDMNQWMTGIENVIKSEGGTLSGILMSRDMTFLYANTTSESIRKLCDCPAILSMSVPRIASTDLDNALDIPIEECVLDKSIDKRDLPKVVLLDDGVNLPPEIDVVTDHFIASDLEPIPGTHGTMVASRLAFGPIDMNLRVLKPRCSIVDYKIINKKDNSGMLASRIREAVERCHKITPLFVMCINNESPFTGEDDEMSIMVDEMHAEYGVVFFISTGNHKLWEFENDILSILEDSDSALASPADAFSAISVGAAVGSSYVDSISPVDGPSPFGRIGPGKNGTTKPNVVGLSGTYLHDHTIPIDRHSTVISPIGFKTMNGTSFTTPDVAGLFVQIRDTIGESGTLMSLAIMHHFARKSTWTCQSKLVDPRNLFGFGIVDESVIEQDPMHESILLRQSSIRAGTDEIITVTIPESIRRLTDKKGNIRIRITCLADAKVDRSKGVDCVRSTIQITLKGQKEKNTEKGGTFWDVCKQRSYQLQSLKENDWCFSLRAYGKDEMKNALIEYALVVSLEDLSGTVDVSSEILADGRYPLLGTVDSHVLNGTPTHIIG